nr:DUF3566 domain-containing protein [Pseudonocardia spinosispora]
MPPPWQRVPASASTTGREAVGGAATAQSGAAAAVTRNTTGASSVATEDTGVPRETRNNLADARTDYLKAPPADPPTTQMRLPLSTPDSGDSEGGSGGGVPGGFPMSWPRNRRPRQAALQLKRLDPWSVLKIALVLAVVLYLVWLVAIGVLYGVLDGIGVWDRLNGQYADLVAEQSGERLISAGRVFGVAAVIGAVNSLLVAVAMSVGAFVYNVAADLVGGVEVTLSERD